MIVIIVQDLTMRIAISLADSHISQKPHFAQKAEQAGFDMIWNSGESIPTFAGMLHETESVNIGSGVLRAFQHHPKNIAQHVLDLQLMYKNRFVLGLGGGTKYMNISTLGEDFSKPATRIREIINFLRYAWSMPAGEPLDFQGQFYQITGAALRWNEDPKKLRAPIYLAAVNPAMLRMAGDICDGLCGHPIASIDFINNVVWPHIDEGLERSNRTRKDFDHQTWVTMSVSKDRKQALKELKVHLARFMATRSYSIVLDSQGFAGVREAIQKAFFNNPNDIDALADALPDEIALQHGIAGNQDDILEQISKYDGVVDGISLYTASNLMSYDRVHESIEMTTDAIASIK
ncbi:MAG: Flavin-dependent oxidoreductase, luciferase family [Chloroflexi bacterium]|jgi:alkanesulfonate monooxygenase SsuD/methylene tetrahydromethanopterin reductase-like flavin-dependent oxidoreductase (luciferase family)|nr:MAG: Flavin-dependent oxidoreductase, luciferase family [Chloroflexota bacterium]